MNLALGNLISEICILAGMFRKYIEFNAEEKDSRIGFRAIIPIINCRIDSQQKLIYLSDRGKRKVKNEEFL